MSKTGLIIHTTKSEGIKIKPYGMQYWRHIFSYTSTFIILTETFKMKSFLIPKLHIKKQNTESQLSPKWHSKGTKRSHQDCGDRRVSQEVSNLANSHCQENHKGITAITKISLSIHHRVEFCKTVLWKGYFFHITGEEGNMGHHLHD